MPLEAIDVGDAPFEHLYTNACVQYDRAPGTYLMFPSRFVPERTPVPDWPYGAGVSDLQAFERHHFSADDFERMTKAAFDVLYRESETSGRVAAISLHPFIVGLPHRIDALDRALEYITGHDGVWCATGSEIVAHFMSQGDG